MRRTLRFASVLAVVTFCLPASAQEYMPAGTFALASGLEGASSDVHRARTRIRVGLELRIDESPDDGLQFAGLVELEPKAAFGGELRYVHSITPRLTLGAGPIAYFAPGTLLGGSAGLEVKGPVGKKTWLTAGPETCVFFLGSDLPNNTIVWQALLQVGFRADF